jgi:hypothetical protein
VTYSSGQWVQLVPTDTSNNTINMPQLLVMPPLSGVKAALNRVIAKQPFCDMDKSMVGLLDPVRNQSNLVNFVIREIVIRRPPYQWYSSLSPEHRNVIFNSPIWYTHNPLWNRPFILK